MGKRFASEGTIKKVMDLSMKLFPNNEITSTEVNDMWSSLNSTPTELDLNYKYSLDKPNNAVTLQQYIGTDPVVTVKSSYDKDDVTYATNIASNDSSSDDYMFSGNDTVESVDFEEGVAVGSNINKMFKNCINLRSVNLSKTDLSGVTSVDETFSGTTNLEKVTEDATNGIPDTVDRSNMFTDSKISDTTKEGIKAGPETELTKWNYTLDDTKNTVNLNQFTDDTTNTDVTVYSAYKKGDKTYNTKITSANRMFYNKTNLKTITFNPGVDSSECTDMKQMFLGSDLKEIKGLENLNTSNVNDMSFMFSQCTNITSLDLTGLNTSKVTDMSSMFYRCANLKEIKGIEDWDVSNVTNMKYMLNGCGNITTLGSFSSSFDLSSWDTSKVTNMYGMFGGCNKPLIIDLIGWHTSKVTSMASMFQYCRNLRKIKVSRNKWVISSGCDTTNMFDSCGVSEVTMG